MYFAAQKEGKIKSLRDAKTCSWNRNGWTPRKSQPSDGGPSSSIVMARIFVCATGATSRGSTFSSAKTWRTETRAPSTPACLVSCGRQEEAKRAKSENTVKMMLRKDPHKKVVGWTRANIPRNAKTYSLPNTLLIIVQGDREKAAVWRFDEHEVKGHTIRLQAIPARMSCDDVLEWVGEEVLKEYKNHHHNRGWQGQNDEGVHNERDDSDDLSPENPPGGTKVESAAGVEDNDEPSETVVCSFVTTGVGVTTGSPGKPLLRAGGRLDGSPPHGLISPVLWRVHQNSPPGFPRLLWAGVQGQTSRAEEGRE